MASHLFFIENRLVNKIREVGLKKKWSSNKSSIFFYGQHGQKVAQWRKNINRWINWLNSFSLRLYRLVIEG